MSPVIRIEHLSKKYPIGHQKQAGGNSLREVLANSASRFFSKLRHPFVAPKIDPTREEFWALQDVSFDILQGDRVGIIGRNGAGKSTLLKILSRITEPTSGKVSITGRVVSLLEVGTGFHPELTGRENIYLNGAILGMSKSEIAKKFDEIVAFAEVERFLDTPVKRYSSGMYVRLAFAVAAHLEPEILIVDEVLAVGDAQFQKKCLGKLQAVGQDGRTVLFVSHNMTAVSALCNKAVVLDNGRLVLTASPETAIKRYLGGESGEHRTSVEWNADNAPGDGTIRLIRVASLNTRGEESKFFDRNESIHIQMEYLMPGKHRLPIAPQIRVFDEAKTCIFVSHKPQTWLNETANSTYASVCVIPDHFMNNKRYFVDVYFTTPYTREVHLHVENIISFEVTDSERNSNFGIIPGTVRPDFQWLTKKIS
ncbi:MAG: ABC transporter ATP-binding protein [Nitrosomonadales bacterium]|nr:ABC transporter ATP-binding protein [Nitrosomonadales bacterium]